MQLRKVKKIYQVRLALLIAVLFACMCLTGCQGNQEAVENQQAYRQVGINKMDEGKFEEAVAAFQKALDQSQAVIGDMELDICYY